MAGRSPGHLSSLVTSTKVGVQLWTSKVKLDSGLCVSTNGQPLAREGRVGEDIEDSATSLRVIDQHAGNSGMR